MISRITVLAFFALAPLAAQASEQSFTRTIKLKDRLDLTVISGAGTIQLTEGPAGVLTVIGHVKANDWHPTDDRLRDIASNPPIQEDRSQERLREQSGDPGQVRSIFHIGFMEESPHIIIDYEIQAPADSIIRASAGVGDIFDDGVGQNARFDTAAGSIHATGLAGRIEAHSNQGDIELEQRGEGDVNAISGTGNLELRNLHGALRATTDSGSIKVSGVPAGDWSVATGRGDIELTLGKAACTIDAQASTGLVHSDLRVDGATGDGARHLAGAINGGGHKVILQVGEGEIHIR